MALEQLEMTTGLNKVDFAIKLLRDNEPDEGYYLADSGGKDSCVVRDLLFKSGCKFDAHYNVSPIDPPQIYSFLKEYHPDTQWDYYARGFWRLVDKKGLPTRNKRWCCEIIKEAGGNLRWVVTGVRASESRNRKDYAFIRSYIRNKVKKVMVSPILQFTEDDVWNYIEKYNIPHCSLYDEMVWHPRKKKMVRKFTRIGCVLCPFSNNRALEEEYFPKQVNLWKVACERSVKADIERGYLSKRGKPLKYKFKTGQEKYDWWTGRK